MTDAAVPPLGPLTGLRPPWTTDPGADRAADRYRFTEAVLMWEHYEATGGPLLLSTLPCPHTRQFCADLETSAARRAPLSRALRRAFGWSALELRALRAGLRTGRERIARKRAIAGFLCALATREGPLGLLERLFGPLPLRAGDVDLVISATALFFCVPFDRGELLRADFSARPPEERRAVRRLLRRLEPNRIRVDAVRFPAFGVLPCDAVDEVLLGRLARHLRRRRLPQGELRRTVETMVTILPTQRAEQYLIHDIWGHGWQELLGGFAGPYQVLAQANAPLSPAVLRGAFGEGAGRTCVDEVSLVQAASADLERRFDATINAVVAEALADLIEHKYVRRLAPAPAAFPSSSSSPLAPLKLDLSHQDIRRCLAHVLAPYVRLIDVAAERRRLALQLAGLGLPRRGLLRAVDEAGLLLSRHFSALWAGDGLASRLMAPLVELEAALRVTLDEADARLGRRGGTDARWQIPSTSIDLLAVLLGWFFQGDRAARYPDLATILRDVICPMLARLDAGSASTGGPHAWPL